MVGYPAVPQSILHCASESYGYVSETFPLKCKIQAFKRQPYLLTSLVFQCEDHEFQTIQVYTQEETLVWGLRVGEVDQ